MMTRLIRRLMDDRQRGRLTLIGYLPVGYPGRTAFGQRVRVGFERGLTAVEVALPGPPSDLDGPFIQRAVQLANNQVNDTIDALALAAAARRSPDDPVIALANATIVAALGLDSLIEAVRSADLDAILLPELPFADQLRAAQAARVAGLEPVLFVHRRRELAALAASGLTRPVIYLQSAAQPTGAALNADEAQHRLAEVRQALAEIDPFVLVGFGVRDADDVRTLARTDADGVIVGTVLVEAADDHEQFGRLITELSAELDKSTDRSETRTP